MADPIPFNQVVLTGRELDHVADVLDRGHLASGGPYTERACAVLRSWLGVQDVLLTTSGTAALEMIGLLLDLGPGDNVIVPSFTYVTTALAFTRTGASVRFADIEPVTFGLDPREVDRLADDRTRAVVAVHYGGLPCDLDGVLAAAGAAGVEVVEDAAEGLRGRHRDRPLGTFGRFAAFSFHDTKAFVCGEGGALVVNDPADHDRARTVLDKGTNRYAFDRGEVDRYSWQDTGSSFALAEVLAAVLTAQLEEGDRIQARRQAIFDRYQAALAPHAAGLGLQLPQVAATALPAGSEYFALLPDGERRPSVIDGLAAAGIGAAFHYVPLHSSAAGERATDRPGPCPVTDDVSSRLLRLPFHHALTDDQVDRVVETLAAILS